MVNGLTQYAVFLYTDRLVQEVEGLDIEPPFDHVQCGSIPDPRSVLLMEIPVE